LVTILAGFGGIIPGHQILPERWPCHTQWCWRLCVSAYNLFHFDSTDISTDFCTPSFLHDRLHDK